MTTVKKECHGFLELFHFKTEGEHHSNLNRQLVQLLSSNICEPFGNFVILSDLVVSNKQDNNSISSPKARHYFSLKAIWETDATDVLED